MAGCCDESRRLGLMKDWMGLLDTAHWKTATGGGKNGFVPFRARAILEAQVVDCCGGRKGLEVYPFGQPASFIIHRIATLSQRSLC